MLVSRTDHGMCCGMMLGWLIEVHMAATRAAMVVLVAALVYPLG